MKNACFITKAKICFKPHANPNPFRGNRYQLAGLFLSKLLSIWAFPTWRLMSFLYSGKKSSALFLLVLSLCHPPLSQPLDCLLNAFNLASTSLNFSVFPSSLFWVILLILSLIIFLKFDCVITAVKTAWESSNSSYSLQNFEKNVILLLECGSTESFIKNKC